MDGTTAIVDRETGEIMTSVPALAMIRPIVTPAAMIEAHKEVSDLITRALVKGTDYGQIPGTGTKPTLLKPGAERLARAFGTVPHYDVTAREIDHDRPVNWTKRKKVWRNQFRGDKVFTWSEESGTSLGLYRFEVRCQLQRLDDGTVVGDGIGVCSTMEAKYVDRPRECENTVLKMAQKRALVAAVLNAFGLSDRFTQDVEEQGDAEEDAAAASEPTDKNGLPPTPSADPRESDAPTIAQQQALTELLTDVRWTKEQVAWAQRKGKNAVTVAEMKEVLETLTAERAKWPAPGRQPGED